jgi:hypothetical protein
MMTKEELQRWAEVQAQDCLRYGTDPIEGLKRNIADHLRDAYEKGVLQEKIRRKEQDENEARPGFTVG